MTGGALPLSPWVYEIGNSLISSLALPLVAILVRFFIVEIRDGGPMAAYARMRVRLGLAICALLVGEAAYRSWTWWGHLCSNEGEKCDWMVSYVWPLVPIGSIAIQVIGMLCMMRILVPGVWGSWSWIVSALLAVTWSLAWFSGWPVVVAYLFG